MEFHCYDLLFVSYLEFPHGYVELPSRKLRMASLLRAFLSSSSHPTSSPPPTPLLVTCSQNTRQHRQGPQSPYTIAINGQPGLAGIQCPVNAWSNASGMNSIGLSARILPQDRQFRSATHALRQGNETRVLSVNTICQLTWLGA